MMTAHAPNLTPIIENNQQAYPLVASQPNRSTIFHPKALASLILQAIQFLPFLLIKAFKPFSAHHARASISRSDPNLFFCGTWMVEMTCEVWWDDVVNGGVGSEQSMTKISVDCVCKDANGSAPGTRGMRILTKGSLV